MKQNIFFTIVEKNILLKTIFAIIFQVSKYLRRVFVHSHKCNVSSFSTITAPLQCIAYTIVKKYIWGEEKKVQT